MDIIHLVAYILMSLFLNYSYHGNLCFISQSVLKVSMAKTVWMYVSVRTERPVTSSLGNATVQLATLAASVA